MRAYFLHYLLGGVSSQWEQTLLHRNLLESRMLGSTGWRKFRGCTTVRWGFVIIMAPQNIYFHLLCESVSEAKGKLVKEESGRWGVRKSQTVCF